MFHVHDHADVVYTGELSQATQYVLERYGKKLDEAIRCGIRITYTDAHSGLNDAGQNTPGSDVPRFWEPIEEWQLD